MLCCTYNSLIQTTLWICLVALKWQYNKLYIYCSLACVANVFNRLIVRKLERAKKKGGRGGGEEEMLARKPHNTGKRPLIFPGSVHL